MTTNPIPVDESALEEAVAAVSLDLGGGTNDPAIWDMHIAVCQRTAKIAIETYLAHLPTTASGDLRERLHDKLLEFMWADQIDATLDAIMPIIESHYTMGQMGTNKGGKE